MRIIDHSNAIYTTARHDVGALPRKGRIGLFRKHVNDDEDHHDREGGYMPRLDPKLAVALTAKMSDEREISEAVARYQSIRHH